MGTVGEITITPEDFEEAMCNRALSIIKEIHNVNPYYLFVFLITNISKLLLERSINGAIQERINLETLGNLTIPILTSDIQCKFESIVKQAHRIRKLSYQYYSDAENILLAELGLKDWNPTNQTSTQKNFTDFLESGRLDAEYYQLKYDEIEDKISIYGSGCIGQLFDIKDKNVTPESDVQYNYIELSNVGDRGEITGCTYEYGLELPSRARRKVNTGDIIVSSIEGSLQSCAIITKDYNNSLCSTGFYVLTPKLVNAETSLMLFKSAPIQQLMKKVCSGTILTAMNKDEFVNIPMPIIAKDIQQQIADKVQRSFELRNESKCLLDLAKTAVETAIEQGEQKVMELLKLN